MVNETSNRVWSAFRDYTQNQDKALISAFPREQLEFTLVEFATDTHSPIYRAIDTRLQRLKEDEQLRRTRADVWRDRGIGFLIAVAAGLVIAVLIWLLGLNK